MSAGDTPEDRIDPDRIRFYTMPTVVRLLAALAVGPRRAHQLAVVGGCRWDETEHALQGLQRRWMVTHEAGSYRLTRSGHFLADRLVCCASELYRALYGRPGLSLPAKPLQIEGVLDDIGHLTELPYREAFLNPTRADATVKEWMASRGYLSEADGAPGLTGTGEAYRTFLDRCGRTIATIDQFNSFFESHSLDDIPTFAVKRIGDLVNGAHLQYLPANSEHGYEYFLEIVEEARSLHGVSSFSLPFIAGAIWERVVEGAEVELVITPELAAPLLQEEFVGTERDAAAFPNFRLFVSTVPVTAGLTVTDRALSLGLCLEDGTYDTVQDLVSRSPEAVRWGERLFRYYKEGAVPIEHYFQNTGDTTESGRSA